MTIAGTLIYDVEINISELSRGQRDINNRLTGVENSFNQLGTAVSRVAASIGAALSVRQILAYSEAWKEVNNKLANSVRDGERVIDVTNRVFEISQDTKSSLAATATLYSRLERSTRGIVTSTDELIDLTTTINKGLMVSGATAEEAARVQVQLSQAFDSGVIRGEEFNAVSENGGRIMMALSDSLGVSIGELRKMAAEGKLTSDVLKRGILMQSKAIAEEASKYVETFGQSLNKATNNVIRFVGESTTIYSTVAAAGSAMITLSENLDHVSTAVIAVSALIGARMSGALVMAASAKIKAAAAAGVLARAELATATAAQFAANTIVRRTTADRAAALSAVALAQAEYNVARGSAAEALALDNLNAKKSIAIAVSANLVVAERALAAATTATAAAARSASVAWGVAKGALALVGGPTGVAVLAAAGLYAYFTSTREATKASFEFADSLRDVITNLDKMSTKQVAAESAKASQAIRTQSEAIEDQRKKIQSMTESLGLAKVAMRGLGESGSRLDRIRDATEQIAIESAKLEKMESQRIETQKGLESMQSKLNESLNKGAESIKKDGESADAAAGSIDNLTGSLNAATDAKNKLNGTGKIELPTPKVDEILAGLRQENKFLSIKDERLRAVAKASAEAQSAGAKVGSESLKLIELEAGKQYDLQKARDSAKDSTKSATREESKATTENKNRMDQLQKLREETELLTLTEQRRYKEAAIKGAVQELGGEATPDQIRQAELLAGQEFDIKQRINDRKAASDANYYEAAKLKRQDDLDQVDRNLKNGIIKFEQAQAQKAAIAANYQKTIAEATAENAVTPQQEMAGMVDPVQALANENAKKLALIQQFEAKKTITENQAAALRNAALTQYEAQRKAAIYEQWKAQSDVNLLLANTFESLQSTASNALTGIITGTTTAGDAMRGLASTALNSLINGFVTMGVEWVKSAIMGSTAQVAATATATTAAVAGTATTTAASTAAAATTVAAWTPAAIVASIGSFGGAAAVGLGAVVAALAMGSIGKRRNGGSVQSGNMYQVGEGGAPEIYQAKGKQYMIPGDNGKVISNKDISGGSGVVINLNVQNYAQANIDHHSTKNSDGSVTIDMIVSDINNGGKIGQAISYSHDAPRRARG